MPLLDPRKTQIPESQAELKRKTARFLDSYIAVYFNIEKFREQHTLGQFLTITIKNLMPDDFLDYLRSK